MANTTSTSGPDCQNVNIKLSTDGGVTFPVTLASDTPNDGTHSVVIPEIPTTTQARIMVEAADNIFLAVSTTNFTINLASPTFFITNTTGDLSGCNSGGGSVVYTLNLNFVNGFSETVTFSTTDQPSGSTVTFNPASVNADGNVTMTVSNLDGVAGQDYTIVVTATSTSVTRNLNADLKVFSSTFSALNLTSPADGQMGVPLDPTYIWNADSNATSYDVEVATNMGFTNIVSSGTVTTNSYWGTSLNQAITYYWRVKPKNSCGEGNFSSGNTFTTQNCLPCTSVANGATPTSTTRVIFNTIDQSSGKDNGGYSDYSNISTDVRANETHNVSVYVNTGGEFTVKTKVWIDWNQDCDFDDANEEYNLGRASNVTDGLTTFSPVSMTIPGDALIGHTVMRVSTKASSNPPTSCENGANGEVEDYTINVVDATASLEDVTFEGFNLYPNPSNGNFTLVFDTVSSENVQLQLFDITGRLVREIPYENVGARFSENIFFGNTSKGLYLLKIKNGSKQTTRKLVIE
ncbi:MAG: T9SS type A sorting domain-containing protein [Flavobacteriaceae bacterium]|nr:MAG: T9SS type A sorting domain-containing protein [Flavobacteriaceae bacterium]